MLSGDYRIVMRTPIGPKQGLLRLETTAGMVEGALTLLGQQTPLQLSLIHISSPARCQHEDRNG